MSLAHIIPSRVSLALQLFPLAVSCLPQLLPIHGSQSVGRTFRMEDEVIGKGFYDSFDFETFDDPTQGRVNYVDQDYAKKNNLTFTSKSKFVMRGDSTNVVQPESRGRNSVRIRSKKKYTDSVVVLDLEHMPTGCATWPAFWTLTADSRWPVGGEIDIIEGVNNQDRNLASLHTTPNCNMNVPGPRKMTGQAESNECDGLKNSNQGCGVRFRKPATYGKGLNDIGGGWFAMRRTQEDGVSVWFWPRNDKSVPDEVRWGTGTVDTDSWGLPEATFPVDNCDMDSHFGAHWIVINLTFCGGWAGNPAVYAATGCSGSCVDLVDNHPEAFLEAYWEINSLRTYV